MPKANCSQLHLRLIIVQEKILDNGDARIYDKTCVFRRFV